MHCGAPRARAFPPDYLSLRSALADCFIRLIGVPPKPTSPVDGCRSQFRRSVTSARNVCFRPPWGAKGTCGHPRVSPNSLMIRTLAIAPLVHLSSWIRRELLLLRSSVQVRTCNNGANHAVRISSIIRLTARAHRPHWRCCRARYRSGSSAAAEEPSQEWTEADGHEYVARKTS